MILELWLFIDPSMTLKTPFDVAQVHNCNSYSYMYLKTTGTLKLKMRGKIISPQKPIFRIFASKGMFVRLLQLLTESS